MTPYVLVVDDEPAIRMVVRLGLERVAGWEVGEASSADGAIDVVSRRRPDAVLLDVMMPEQDGPATLARLRELAGDDLRVVFLTASGPGGETQRLRDLGVAGVIRKPFDPMSLAAEIATVLGWEIPS